MVEPRANSATPSRRATSTLGANSVAMPSASKREAHDSAPARYRHVTMPDARVCQRRRHRAQIPGFHHDVAIVHQEDGVPRPPRQFRQHADLGIGRRGGNDRDLDAQSGKLALQALDILQRRIVGSVHAEEDFELGIVLRGVRQDGFVEARIASVNRFEDGERLAGRAAAAARAGRQRAAAIITRQ